MKNKNKSSKVQKYVQQVQQQQAQAGKNKQEVSKITRLIRGQVTNGQLAKQKEAEARKKQKEAEAAKKKMDAQLFATAQVQKVPFGTDPKTVLCVYFKAGHCAKGRYLYSCRADRQETSASSRTTLMLDVRPRRSTFTRTLVKTRRPVSSGLPGRVP